MLICALLILSLPETLIVALIDLIGIRACLALRRVGKTFFRIMAWHVLSNSVSPLSIAWDLAEHAGRHHRAACSNNARCEPVFPSKIHRKGSLPPLPPKTTTSTLPPSHTNVLSHTHTHTHTHKHTHKYTHAHTHIHRGLHTTRHSRAQIFALIIRYTHIYTQALSLSLVYKHTRAYDKE
jgi:hypothetical protein